ncbi:MAG: peptidylprolyl isomerase [Candidatus Acidiferrales bacterium]
MKRFSRIIGAITVAAMALAAGVTAQTKAPAKKAAGASSRPYPAALLKPATFTAKAPEEFEVQFVTSKGDFTVKVIRAWAPQGADRFYNLVQNKFYDGAAFFRVVPGFMVQFGLSPYPEVSKAWRAATITDDPVTQSNKRGFITYAKTAQPNSRTTQVYINFGDNSRLDPMGFAPFGEVTQGMEVVDQLHGGYGDGAPRGKGPSQDLIQTQGRTYLEKDFPLLDTIKSARIVTPSPKPQP